MTERTRRTWPGGRTEGEGEERSRVGGHDSSSVKPLEAPTPPVSNGPMTSSRWTRNKGPKRGPSRTTEKGELSESTLDKLSQTFVCVVCLFFFFFFYCCSRSLKDSTQTLSDGRNRDRRFKWPAGRIVLVCLFTLLLSLFLNAQPTIIKKTKKQKHCFRMNCCLKKRNSHDFFFIYLKF